MKSYTLLKATALIIAIGIGIYFYIASASVEVPRDWVAWKTALLQARTEKNEFMKTDSESPIPMTERALFTGLNYFDADSTWVLQADVELIKPPSPKMFSTSNGVPKRYLAVAKLHFERQGTKFSLTMYQSIGITKNYFLPITDNTSARTTYGAGRYVDFEHLDGKQIYPDQPLEVDFNKAYNPYCAYADGFSCPFPPLENNIPLELTAGEKNY